MRRAAVVAVAVIVGRRGVGGRGRVGTVPVVVVAVGIVAVRRRRSVAVPGRGGVDRVGRRAAAGAGWAA